MNQNEFINTVDKAIESSRTSWSIKSLEDPKGSKQTRVIQMAEIVKLEPVKRNEGTPDQPKIKSFYQIQLANIDHKFNLPYTVMTSLKGYMESIDVRNFRIKWDGEGLKTKYMVMVNVE